jgi:hypothetical protein
MPAPEDAPKARRTPGWLINGLAVLAFASCLAVAAIPGYNPFSLVRSGDPSPIGIIQVLLGVVILPPWSLWWLVWVGWSFRDWQFRLSREGSAPARRWAWRLAPTLAVVLVVLLAADVPLRLAFPLHRPGLERLLAEALQAPKGELEAPRWVGLYPVDGVRRIDARTGFAERASPDRRNVYLRESHMPFYEGAGFFYDPNVADPLIGFYKGRQSQKPIVSLGGGWYAFVVIDDD